MWQEITPIVLVILMVALLVANRLFDWPWLCAAMAHRFPKKLEFDGRNIHGVCPRCKKRIMRGDRGDWYTLARQIDEEIIN